MIKALGNMNEKELTDYAYEKLRLRCCKQFCLLKHYKGDSGLAANLVVSCFREYRSMTRTERKEFFSEKVRGTIQNFHVSGYTNHKWKVGPNSTDCVEGVCRRCFLNCYEVSKSTVIGLIKEIKEGTVVPNSDFRVNSKVSPTVINALQISAEKRGHILSREQLATLQIPSTNGSVFCYTWMHNHFKLVGDQIPNSDGEIHIESLTRQEIWSEYRDFMTNFGEEFVSMEAFRSLWKSCFNHVKVRKYKAVTGKCNTCAWLSHARSTFKDRARRERVTVLHAAHRLAYMGERLEYHLRRQRALELPDICCSMITDGMAMHHCNVPHIGNKKAFEVCLTQHLQGVINHGRNFTVFRTFHNIVLGASVQLHCFLLELESLRMREGRLPNTIYFQVDGGAENVAKSVLVMMELLIAKRLTQTIIVTRLMVGHTHEDIDARFGVMWKYFRQRDLLTPQAYAGGIVSAFKNKSQVAVSDVWVVPDYDVLVKPHMDKAFSRYAKTKWTQLQFRFEAVDVSENFPLGVKTTYRRYAKDNVPEIVECSLDKDITGYVDEYCDIQWFPAAKPATEARGNQPGKPARPEGMYLLKSLPTKSMIRPKGFKAGSRAELDATLKRVNRDLPQEDREAWVEFAKDAPDSDDVQAFLRKRPQAMHVPFLEELWGDAVIDYDFPVLPVDSRSRLQSGMFPNRQKHTTKATECVMWDNRGDACDQVSEPTIPSGSYAKETTRNCHGNDTSTTKRCAKRPATTETVNKKHKKRRTVVETPDDEEDCPRTDSHMESTPDASNDRHSSNYIPLACTDSPQTTTHSGFKACACHPASNCVYPQLDASLSQHKCYKCRAGIFVPCMPLFESTNKILCRHCVGASGSCTSKTASRKKPAERPKVSCNIRSDSDGDVSPSIQQKVDIYSSVRTTRTQTRPKRAAAMKASKMTSEMLTGALDYHEQPHLLYSSHVHRLTTGKSGTKTDFYGEVTGYDARAKKWHIHYFESDCESEDLNVQETLDSLRDKE